MRGAAAHWQLVLLACAFLPIPTTAAPSSADYHHIGRDQLLTVMRAPRAYDPMTTTNGGRFQVDVLLALAEAAAAAKVDRPLFIGHKEWFEALAEATGRSPAQMPLYTRLAYEHGQDMLAEYRTERVIERVVKGPPLRRALEVSVAWPAKAGATDRYSFEDTLARPTLNVTNHRQIHYRLLAFSDRILLDEIEGLSGRPNSGALGLLFKLIGEGSVVEYRMATASDAVQVSRGRARKGFLGVTSTITVQPDGRAEKDVPADRADLKALAKRLDEEIEVLYQPARLSLYSTPGGR